MISDVVGRNARTGGPVGKCAYGLREEDGFVLPEGSLILAFPSSRWGGGVREEVQKIFSVRGGENFFFRASPFFSPFV